jgi:hypothetical protein
VNPTRETRKLNTPRSCARRVLTARTIAAPSPLHRRPGASPALPGQGGFLVRLKRRFSVPALISPPMPRPAGGQGWPRTSRGHRPWRREACLRAGRARHQAGAGRAASPAGGRTRRWRTPGLELFRCPVRQCRMQSLPVVYGPDKRRNRRFCFGLIAVRLAVHLLSF